MRNAPLLRPRLLALALAGLLQGCASVLPLLAAAGAPERATAPIRPAAADAAATAAAATASPAPAETRDTYLAVVEQLGREGQHFAAYAHLQALEAQFGGGPEVTLLKADALRASGDAEAAARLYGELLAGPQSARAYHGLGLIAGARHDYASAATLLERAAQREPTHARLLSDLGYALLLGGRPEQARRPLLTAAELAPQDARIQANVALYRRSVGGPGAGCAPGTAPAAQPTDAVRLALGLGADGCAPTPMTPPLAARSPALQAPALTGGLQ
jgi:tetratricopeptide (TPR) repeat protein